METPHDFEHPVAGTRQFGIYENPQNPDEMIFYISGVDRIWDFWTEVGNDLIINGFNKGDQLWEDVINNFTSKINSLGGKATSNHIWNVKERYAWGILRAYLKGEKSFQELKTELGC